MEPDNREELVRKRWISLVMVLVIALGIAALLHLLLGSALDMPPFVAGKAPFPGPFGAVLTKLGVKFATVPKSPTGEAI